MQSMLIKAGILFAVYKYAPHQAIKAMALGYAGTVLFGQYVPYTNGKNLKGEAV